MEKRRRVPHRQEAQRKNHVNHIHQKGKEKLGESLNARKEPVTG